LLFYNIYVGKKKKINTMHLKLMQKRQKCLVTKTKNANGDRWGNNLAKLYAEIAQPVIVIITFIRVL